MFLLVQSCQFAAEQGVAILQHGTRDRSGECGDLVANGPGDREGGGRSKGAVLTTTLAPSLPVAMNTSCSVVIDMYLMHNIFVVVFVTRLSCFYFFYFQLRPVSSCFSTSI